MRSKAQARAAAKSSARKAPRKAVLPAPAQVPVPGVRLPDGRFLPALGPNEGVVVEFETGTLRTDPATMRRVRVEKL